MGKFHIQGVQVEKAVSVTLHLTWNLMRCSLGAKGTDLSPPPFFHLVDFVQIHVSIGGGGYYEGSQEVAI